MMHVVSIRGCDGRTEFLLDLTEAEAAAIQRVCEKSREVSTYGCEPVIVCQEQHAAFEEWKQANPFYEYFEDEPPSWAPKEETPR